MEKSCHQIFNLGHHIASQKTWTRKAKSTDIEELLICQGEGFSDEKLKHKHFLEMDDDTDVDDTQVQRKQNHVVLSCYVTRIAETAHSFVELFWMQPNAVKRERERVLILTVALTA
jgi:hypothetical protein